jgi:hypothetical protein
MGAQQKAHELKARSNSEGTNGELWLWFLFNQSIPSIFRVAAGANAQRGNDFAGLGADIGTHKPEGGKGEGKMNAIWGM